MKKNIVMISIVVVNYIFQTSLYNFLDIFGVIPNISLIFVIIFAMMSDGITGGAIGLLTGILYDTMMFDIFGIYTLLYFIVGAVIGTYSSEMNRENHILYSGLAAVSTVFMNVCLYIILFFLRYKVENFLSIMSRILLEIILNALMAFVVLRIVNSVFRKLEIK
jgi:rod shape-determining protein MreD